MKENRVAPHGEPPWNCRKRPLLQALLEVLELLLELGALFLDGLMTIGLALSANLLAGLLGQILLTLLGLIDLVGNLGGIPMYDRAIHSLELHVEVRRVILLHKGDEGRLPTSSERLL